MRRRLVIAVVIGSMLYLQAPAQATHLYMRMRPTNGSTYVATDCPVGQTLAVKSGTVRQTVTVPASTFTTTRLNTVARLSGSYSATCNGHSISNVSRLALTGITTAQKLVVGLGLVAAGVVLLAFGARPPGGRPRRRPPVKVWAQ